MTENNPKMLNWAEGFLIFIIVLSIILFSSFNIGRSFWLDEAYSYFLASKGSFSEIVDAVKETAGPPLYYFILSFWMKIFGISETAIRSLSSVFYIISFPAIYYLGRVIYKDKRTALICSFLFMLSPIVYRHGQNARMYSMFVFVAILSSIFFFKLMLEDRDSKKDIFLFIITNIVGTFTHFWYFFYLLSQGLIYLCLFYKKEDKTFRLSLFFSIVPFWMLWTPFLFNQVKGVSAFEEKPTIYSLVETIFCFYGYVDMMNWLVAFLVYLGFIVVAFIKIENDKLKIEEFSQVKLFIYQKQNIALLMLFFLSLTTPFLFSQIKPIFLAHRYTIIGAFPLAIFFGGLISKFSNRLVLVGFGYLLVTLYTSTFVNRAIEPTRYVFSDKVTSQYLINNTRNNDILIFTSYSQMTIDYYFILFKSNKNLKKIAYPTGFMHSDIALKDRLSLEKEAVSLTKQLQELAKDPKTKIWLFYGYDLEVSDFLKNKLDNNFRPTKELDLRGSFFDRVLIYQPK